MRRLRISKESAIALASYEKRSFYRFYLIYLSVFILLLAAIGTLYYYKERNRYFQEQKVQLRLAFSECERLQKMLGADKPCLMEAVDLSEALKTTYAEIAAALALAMIIIIPTGYLLALVSMRPMRESVRTIDSFIHGIVHDINTPLSVIKLNAQAIAPRLDEPLLIQKNARILHSVADIEALEEQLMFSLKADRYAPAFIRFDLHAMLQDRLDYYNSIRQAVPVTYEGEPFALHADTLLIKRMIDNIVLNAIKFSPRHATVALRLSKGIMQIEDHGIGIKAPKKVFAKYYREQHESKGLGLGLYIVNTVAKLHGIKIQIDSTPGEGTTFTLDFRPSGV